MHVESSEVCLLDINPTFSCFLCCFFSCKGQKRDTEAERETVDILMKVSLQFSPAYFPSDREGTRSQLELPDIRPT